MIWADEGADDVFGGEVAGDVDGRIGVVTFFFFTSLAAIASFVVGSSTSNKEHIASSFACVISSFSASETLT